MSERKEKTFAFWKNEAPTIQSMMQLKIAESIHEEELSEVLSYLPPLQGKKILELGAGIGRFTGHLAEKAQQLTSVDFNETFLKKNRDSHIECKNITYLCKDAMNLDFEKNSFDFIFINWLLMYLDTSEVEDLSNSLFSWLKKDGHLFFRESCSASYKMLQGHYYAHYRSPFYYTELFKNRLSLLHQESIKLYEELFANPFNCFWLYTKKTEKSDLGN